MPLGLRPKLMPLGLRPKLMPLGLRPKLMPLGLRPKLMPLGLRPKLMPLGLRPKLMPLGLRPKLMPLGLRPKLMPLGLRPKLMPLGLRPKLMPLGLRPKLMPLGLSPKLMPLGLSPKLMPLGLSPKLMPLGLSPKLMPLGLRPKLMPLGLRPKLMPLAHGPESEPLAHGPESEPLAHAPGSESLAHASGSESLAHASGSEPRAHAPGSEAQAHAPGSEAQAHAPESEPLAHAPESEPLAHAPGSESQAHASGSESLAHASGSESLAHAPGSEPQAYAPGSETQASAPGFEPQAHVPQATVLKSHGPQAPVTVPGPQTPVTGPGSQTPVTVSGPQAPVTVYEPRVPVPGSEPQTPVPGSEPQTLVPGSEPQAPVLQAPVPGSEPQTHVPGPPAPAPACAVPAPATFSLVVPDGVLSGQLGSSVVLPCIVSPALDCTSYEVRWHRPKDKHNPILLYKDLKIQENTGDPRYRNRVSLIGALGKGDVSLKLENLTLADRGEYVCYVNSVKWYDRGNMFLNLPDSEGLVGISSWLLVFPSESEWISCSVGLSDQEMKEGRVLLLKPAYKPDSGNDPDSTGVCPGWKAFIILLVISLLMLAVMAVFIFNIRGTFPEVWADRPKPYRKPLGEDEEESSQAWSSESEGSGEVLYGGFRAFALCIQVAIKPLSSDSTLGCWFTERIDSGQYYWEVTGLREVQLNTGRVTSLFKKTFKCPTSWYVGVTNQSAEQKSEVPVTPQNGYWVLQYDEDNGYYVNDPSLTPVLVRETFSVVVPDGVIPGQLGSSVVLPCTVSPALDCRGYEVRWYSPKDKQNSILLYKGLKVQENSEILRYRNRGFLIGELEKGNVSLKLENLTLADRGEYVCYVNSYEWYDRASVFLNLPVVGSLPVLSFTEAGEQVNVTCESGGWSSNPTLIWRDKVGRGLRSFDHYKTDSEGLVSVSSWLLFSPLESEWISCSVGLSDQEMKEGRVLPLKPVYKPDSVNDPNCPLDPVAIKLQSSDSTLGCWFKEKIHSGQYYWEVTRLADVPVDTGLFSSIYRSPICPTSCSDHSCLSFVISYLTGKDLDWATTVWSTYQTGNYKCFIQDFKVVFDYPNEGRSSSVLFRQLRQGNWSLAYYLLDFHIVAAGSSWNEPVLVVVYRN
ncbi:hypothetical protein NFI96_031381 [Prochilodus magdalenae]|nr:hypothetical protein NFI96_031381 [Prochilodus magdalenae]